MEPCKKAAKTESGAFKKLDAWALKKLVVKDGYLKSLPLPCLWADGALWFLVCEPQLDVGLLCQNLSHCVAGCEERDGVCSAF